MLSREVSLAATSCIKKGQRLEAWRQFTRTQAINIDLDQGVGSEEWSDCRAVLNKIRDVRNRGVKIFDRMTLTELKR